MRFSSPADPPACASRHDAGLRGVDARYMRDTVATNRRRSVVWRVWASPPPYHRVYMFRCDRPAVMTLPPQTGRWRHRVPGGEHGLPPGTIISEERGQARG